VGRGKETCEGMRWEMEWQKKTVQGKDGLGEPGRMVDA